MFSIIESLMKEKNIKPLTVSKNTGITVASLSDWKTGKSKPNTESLVRLANYFGVSVDYLLGRTTRRKPYRS